MTFVTNWLFLTINVIVVGFLGFRMMYFKSLWDKEKGSTGATKKTLEEAENLVRKYQIHITRALGDIDVLNEELNKLRADVKSVKSKNAQYRAENERLKSRIKELENKIEALI